jgi:Zn-dependent peptidase ImmA (M78 family)
MTRYEDAGQDVKDLAKEIIAEFMPELRSVKINYLYDLKKRKSGGFYTLARCQKSNDLIKYLTIDESGDEEGYQYIIYLDKMIWNNIEKPDKIKLLRHELRHVWIDPDAKSPYKLCDHDVSDFYEEIELNVDDPRWSERLSGLVESLYEQEEDMEESE